jgi:hypothetical protein
MPPVNRDSSDLTRKRAAKTLYTWNVANKVSVAAGGIHREQSSFQTLDVTPPRLFGACYCAATGYDCVGCGCKGNNLGGGNYGWEQLWSRIPVGPIWRYIFKSSCSGWTHGESKKILFYYARSFPGPKGRVLPLPPPGSLNFLGRPVIFFSDELREEN